MKANKEAERIIETFNFLNDRKLQIKCAIFAHLEVLRFMGTEENFNYMKHLEEKRAPFWMEVNEELSRLSIMENPTIYQDIN
jgi:hypothetical protein